MLKSLVRARGDAQLMNIIAILRRHDLQPDDIEYVIQALTQRCEGNRVDNALQVPDGVMTIVGTRAAMDQISTEVLEKKKNYTAPEDQVECIATDEINKFGGNWLEADATVTRKLDRALHQPKKLYLFKNWVYQLTFNNNKNTRNLPRFSQGQLCLIEKLPTGQDDSVHVRILPPGTRQVNLNDNHTIAEWRRAIIKRRDSFSVIVGTGMQKGRRNQYPLNYNISCTAHRAMGETLPSVATRIEEGTHYRLWDRNQLLVIISRVTNLDNITFIGNWDRTVLALRQILKLECHMTKLQSNILTRLDRLGEGQFRTIPTLRDKGMYLTDCDVADVDIGFVYLFCSSKNMNKIKVGHCSNLKKEIKEMHSQSLLDPDAPYILVGYFCGFFGDGESDRNRGARVILETRMTYNVYLARIGLFGMLDIKDQILREDVQNNQVQFKYVVWKECVHFNRDRWQIRQRQ